MTAIFDDQQNSIGELLTRALYQQEKQFWIKTVRLSGFAAPFEIPVEFLAPTPLDTDSAVSLMQKVRELQDIYPAALDGIALALCSPRQILLSGETPGGNVLSDVPLQVVDPAMLILIKAIAFADRLQKHRRDPQNHHEDHAAKHAYDISQLVLRYPGGVSALIERLIPPYLTQAGPEQPTIARALQSLRDHFLSVESQGIRLMVGEGKYKYEKSEKEFDQQGTIGRVQRLLNGLNEKAESIY